MDAGFTQALFNSGEEVLRHAAAEHFLCKDHILALVLRLKDDMHVAKLAAAAGLLLMTTLLADLLTNLLAVSHPGCIQLSFHAKAALELAHQHIDLDIAGAGNHHLVSLGVVDHAEGGILFVKAEKTGAHLFILATGLGSNGTGIAGLGKLHGRQLHHVLGIAQGIAGLKPIHLGNGADVSAGNLLDFLSLLAADGVQTAQLLGLAGRGIIKGHVAGNLAGNNLNQGIFAVLIGNGLEHDGGSGAVGIAGHFDFLLARLVGCDFSRHFSGSGNQIHNGLEQHLGAKARESGAAENRGNSAVPHTYLQAVMDLLFSEGLTGEKLLHILFGGLRNSLHQLIIQLVHHMDFVLGDGNLHPLALLVVGHLISLLVEHIDNTDGTLVFIPDGSHHRGDGLAEVFPQGLQSGGEVGILLIFLGDIDDAGLLLRLEVLPAALSTYGEAVLGSTD